MTGNNETPPKRGPENRLGGDNPNGNTSTGADTAHLANLLDKVVAHLRRFVVFPPHAAVAVALWIAYTHAAREFDVAPYILITAPEIESGKTRVMEVAARICHQPMFSSSMTPAVLFRTIDRDHPTLFLDEADNLWTGRKDDKATELVALLNAGHRRGMKAQRMGGVGKTTLQEFDVFGAKAIAGAFPNTGNIPEALRSRAIHVRMQRKLPSEKVDRWTRQTREASADALDQLRDGLAETVPAMRPADFHIEPVEDLSDREFDIWEPLLCIAATAGGHWPATALDAALALSAADASQAVPLRIILLRDLREVWDDDAAHMLTATLLERLHQLDERPWRDFYGHPLSARRMGQMLSAYGVESKFEPGPERRKGYYRQDLEDLWRRYVSEPSQPSQRSQIKAHRGEPESFESMESLQQEQEQLDYDDETRRIAP